MTTSVHCVLLADMPAQAWRNGGGVTRALLAWPTDDDWHVRISVAEIERDGPFSAFDGVERWFTVLHGVGVRLRMQQSPMQMQMQMQMQMPMPMPMHGQANQPAHVQDDMRSTGRSTGQATGRESGRDSGQESQQYSQSANGLVYTLRPGSPPLQFDGAAAPGCALLAGPTQDLNLMLRRQAGSGRMDRATAAVGWTSAATWRAVYCAGAAQLRIGGQPLAALPQAGLLWCDNAAGQAWQIDALAPSASAWWLSFQPSR